MKSKEKLHQELRNTILNLPGVIERQNAGIHEDAFFVGGKMFMHIHGYGHCDIRLSKDDQERALMEGKARRHRWAPEAGYVTLMVKNEADLPAAMELIRMSYQHFANKHSVLRKLTEKIAKTAVKKSEKERQQEAKMKAQDRGTGATPAAGAKAGASQGTLTTSDAIPWKPVDPKHPGLQMFAVWGNPNQGASLILQKFPAGMDSGWHWHTAAVALHLNRGLWPFIVLNSWTGGRSICLNLGNCT